MHGLRYPVLQQRLPTRKPDPRLERPGLSRALARRDRSPARHQQLPGVHRPAVPGAVRGGMCAGHQRRPGDHQAGRGRDHRPGVGRGLGRAATAERQDRQARRRHRFGPCGAGLSTAVDPSRSRCRRARTRRPHRWPAALWHPRVQDGEASPAAPYCPDGGRRHRVPHQRSGRRRRRHRGPAGLVRRDRVGVRSHGGP